MEERLIFLISTPRSGSTLLMRILNATSEIFSRPEPHLLPALAHLGFWDTVDKAPYDQFQAQQAIRDFVAELPNGESDYYAACRAYTDGLYGAMFETATGSEQFFLDKTPANALVLPYLSKLYPNAKYIILARHPAAIFSSYANSFFDGDYAAAEKFNPILSRYIPVISAFLRKAPTDVLHIRYEDLVCSPEETLARVSEYLDIKFDPAALNYQKESVSDGLGDPLGVNQHQRPVMDSLDKWAPELAADAQKLAHVVGQLERVSDQDLLTYGYSREALWTALESVDPNAYKNRKGQWSRYALTRRLLVFLRRDINDKAHGRFVRKIRDYCNILLRG